MCRKVKVRKQERGLLFKQGEFVRVLQPGEYRFFSGKMKVEMSSLVDWIRHPDLAVIAKSGALDAEALMLDLADDERALVWFDGRFEALLGPGLHAVWKPMLDVKVERVNTEQARFVHSKISTILAKPGSDVLLQRVDVDAEHVALLYIDGVHQAVLEPGVHAYWRSAGVIKALHVDRRERVLDVSGQEILTADKVTLRLNALVTYRVVDPLKAVSAVDDYTQAIYREAQLALREAIGTRELDALLSDKEAVSKELAELLKGRAGGFGIEVLSLGIRDIILPGDMRELLNKVTEARKVAEASLITRREETAAMRSAANTAKILESNPMLMRLRELETLERVADKANLTLVLGEKGLAERLVKAV
ncbi:MAG: slipin family protein [Deltaproteobacteria bacterium]|nr:slipin family protein [Deltaproteobacteria bacterium]